MSSRRFGSTDWQKKSRKFALSYHHLFGDIAWGGREITLYLIMCKKFFLTGLLRLTAGLDGKKLQDRLSTTNPAFYAEMVHRLQSADYAQEPEGVQMWTNVPSVLDLIKSLTRGCVTWVGARPFRLTADIGLEKPLSTVR